ncbi:MAG: glycosyltransferase family 4 protein [Anaerolineaceae bacterium]|nr:glycosyltransferase family 4 protein [Anaerolineaceae bacterium]
MHILLIHQAFVTTGEAGGTRHIEFAKRLADKGHRVTIITSPVSYLSGESSFGGHFFWKKEQWAENIEIRYCWTSSGMHKGFVPRLFAFFSFMFSSFLCALNVKDVDVVWGTSPNLFQGWTAWLSARCKRKKFLLEIRDLWPEFAVAMGALRNPLLIRMSQWLEKFLYNHADRIIVNSPGFIPYIREISGKTPDLVPNGADETMFEGADGSAFRAQYGLGDEFVVMYSGAHGPANDLETVLNAADLLRERRDIRFVFVGSGKDKPRLEAIKAEKGLDNVLFVPPVSKDHIASVMAAEDAGLAILKDLDMFKTTYPNKVFDIMACGDPVICQIDGVIREVVEENHGGVFVKPGDPKALAEAVLKLSGDPESCRKMGENGRKAIIEKFNRDKAAEQLEKIFVELGNIGYRR